MGEEATVVPAVSISSTPHFVLVHGIGGGSWCWYKIRCLMENSGYKVTCIDLKSAGIDPSDANSVLTFDQYNQPLIDFLSSLPENEQVILVGHSAGGLNVTQACHKFGKKKIRLAVYVAAAMLKFGFSTDQDVQDVSKLFLNQVVWILLLLAQHVQEVVDTPQMMFLNKENELLVEEEFEVSVGSNKIVREEEFGLV